MPSNVEKLCRCRPQRFKVTLGPLTSPDTVDEWIELIHQCEAPSLIIEFPSTIIRMEQYALRVPCSWQWDNSTWGWCSSHCEQIPRQSCCQPSWHWYEVGRLFDALRSIQALSAGGINEVILKNLSLSEATAQVVFVALLKSKSSSSSSSVNNNNYHTYQKRVGKLLRKPLPGGVARVVTSYLPKGPPDRIVLHKCHLDIGAVHILQRVVFPESQLKLQECMALNDFQRIFPVDDDDDDRT